MHIKKHKHETNLNAMAWLMFRIEVKHEAVIDLIKIQFHPASDLNISYP